MGNVGATRQAWPMTSPHTPRSPGRVPRPPLDDDLARALIRARVRRQHRRGQRVLTRV